MTYDDDLDRAIFALELESPPPGLREAILRATIYAPSLAMRLWEVIGLGAALAVSCWLAIELLTNKAFSGAAVSAIVAFVQFLTQPTTFESLALGIAVVVWLSFLDAVPIRIRIPHRS